MRKGEVVARDAHVIVYGQHAVGVRAFRQGEEAAADADAWGRKKII
jgi:hypothetical protein